MEDVVIEGVGIGRYEGVDLKDLAGSMILDHNAPSICEIVSKIKSK